MRRLLRKRGEKGANLVEFAILAPFLILLLFGIIEFAWVFATNLDVKHGAREGARITAVNTPDTGNVDLAAEICSRMSIVGSDTATTITWASDGTPAVGEGVIVTVSTPLSTLTGIMDWAFGSGPTLDSTVEMRIEQPPDWSDGTQNCV